MYALLVSLRVCWPDAAAEAATQRRPAAAPQRFHAARTAARQEGVTVARTLRSVVSFAGLGNSGIGRAGSRSSLSALVYSQLYRSREAVQGYASGLGLFYAGQVNADQSGQLTFYTDSTQRNSVGTISWNAPIWSGAVGTYPIRLHFTFSLQAGTAPASGQMDVVVNDAGGASGRITGSLNDNAGDRASFDLTLSADGTRGSISANSSDGASAQLTCRPRAGAT